MEITKKEKQKVSLQSQVNEAEKKKTTEQIMRETQAQIEENLKKSDELQNIFDLTKAEEERLQAELDGLKLRSAILTYMDIAQKQQVEFAKTLKAAATTIAQLEFDAKNRRVYENTLTPDAIRKIIHQELDGLNPKQQMGYVDRSIGYYFDELQKDVIKFLSEYSNKQTVQNGVLSMLLVANIVLTVVL